MSKGKIRPRKVVLAADIRFLQTVKRMMEQLKLITLAAPLAMGRPSPRIERNVAKFEAVLRAK